MHVAGEIFRTTIFQSSSGVWETENSLSAEATSLMGMPDDEDCLHPAEIAIVASAARKPFHIALPDGKDAPDFIYGLYSIVRLAALLHDIGHLPFSHVFEFAVRQCTRESYKWTKRATEIKYRKKLHDLIALESSSNEKLHELFGGRLMEFLAENSRCRGKQESSILSKLVRKASKVLHAKNLNSPVQSTNSYPIAKSFISGMIDAYRIDFIRRDTQFSGLLTSSVDYGRLFAFFQLQRDSTKSVQTDFLAEDKPKAYEAVPGNRALSETEKLLWERFQEYKYIACHHKVLLNDELLERCIAALISNGCIDELLDSLTKLIDQPASQGFASDLRQNYNHIISLLTEFDDAALEAKARQAYREIIFSQISGGKKHMRLFSIREQILVTRYIEGSSSLESAFRTDEQFWKYLATEFPASGLLNDESLLPIQRSEAALSIGRRVNEMKYELENRWFQNQSQLIIIGDVYNKLKTGIMSDSTLDLKKLGEFLDGKIADTPPFNFWYLKDPDEARNAFLKKEICGFLVKALMTPESR